MSRPSALPVIESIFRQRFGRWHIALPREAITGRSRGEINEKGWLVQYLFGADERGEFLDFYSSHRMAGDEHCRIYESGEVESLESLQGCYSWHPGKEGDQERAKAEYLKRNRRIAAILAQKGFGLTINGLLRSGIIDE